MQVFDLKPEILLCVDQCLASDEENGDQILAFKEDSLGAGVLKCVWGETERTREEKQAYVWIYLKMQIKLTIRYFLAIRDFTI